MYYLITEAVGNNMDHIRRQDTAELVELSSPSEEVFVYRAVFGSFLSLGAHCSSPWPMWDPTCPVGPLAEAKGCDVRCRFRSIFLELKYLDENDWIPRNGLYWMLNKYIYIFRINTSFKLLKFVYLLLLLFYLEIKICLFLSPTHHPCASSHKIIYMLIT